MVTPLLGNFWLQHTRKAKSIQSISSSFYHTFGKSRRQLRSTLIIWNFRQRLAERCRICRSFEISKNNLLKDGMWATSAWERWGRCAERTDEVGVCTYWLQVFYPFILHSRLTSKWVSVKDWWNVTILLTYFWTKDRSSGPKIVLWVFMAKFWVTDVKLVVEVEKKIIFVIRPSNG
jgi:hypothetical protein